ncbi:MAG: hypothetical protein KDD62_04595 [Bdellovibrionales bacterium]|nr:hypothetical protein [Bdellovibrionales bacterium]
MSEFSNKLEKVLDETGFFDNRQEWSEFLGVPTTKIEDWISDESFPSGNDLFMIDTGLAYSSLQDHPAFLEFRQMAARPIEEVSPCVPIDDKPGVKADMSVLEYLQLPAFPNGRLT